MATFGNVWQRMATFDNYWRLLATYGNFGLLMATHGNLWQLMATFGDWWRLLATFGNLWQLLAAYGNFWQQMETFGKFWQLMATLAAYGYFWQLMATFGKFWQPSTIHLSRPNCFLRLFHNDSTFTQLSRFSTILHNLTHNLCTMTNIRKRPKLRTDPHSDFTQKKVTCVAGDEELLKNWWRTDDQAI